MKIIEMILRNEFSLLGEIKHITVDFWSYLCKEKLDFVTEEQSCDLRLVVGIIRLYLEFVCSLCTREVPWI